jgi:hypothetical protein
METDKIRNFVVSSDDPCIFFTVVVDKLKIL